MANVGPTRALTVTFLIPVFAMLWGVLFLGEPVTPSTVLGAALILGGTFLVAVKQAVPVPNSTAYRGRGLRLRIERRP